MAAIVLANGVGDIKEKEAIGTSPRCLEIYLHSTAGHNADILEITYEAAADLALKISSRLSQRALPVILELPSGYTEIKQRAESFTVSQLDDAGFLVKLNASLTSDPEMRQSFGRPPEATTVALRTDQTAAIVLFKRIRALARKMGWPLPKEDEPQV